MFDKLPLNVAPDDPRLKFLDSQLAPIEHLPEELPDRLPAAEGVHVAPAIEQVSPEVKTRTIRGTLKERSDMMFFHLGGIYELVRLPHDLMRQFRVDEIYQGPVEDFNFSRGLFEGLHNWGAVLQAIPLGAKDRFIRWLLGQVFVRGNVWWRSRRQTVSIPDPVRVDAGAIIGPDDMMQVDVFLPFGSRGMTYLRPQGPGRPWKVTFQAGVVPPKETVPPGWAVVQ